MDKLDVKTRSRINLRLVRLEYGAYSDHKNLGNKLWELRFFFARGYRIYFTEHENKIIILYFEDHNKELFLASLKEVIQAGVSEFSKQTHINRQHIYKMLSTKGNPSLNNIGSLLTALGLKLQVENVGHSIH